MSDLLHTHLTIGFVDGCPACEQVLQDLEVGSLEIAGRI